MITFLILLLIDTMEQIKNKITAGNNQLNAKIVENHKKLDAKTAALKKAITDKITELEESYKTQLDTNKNNDERIFAMFEEQKEINRKNSEQIKKLELICDSISKNLQKITEFMDEATRTYRTDMQTLIPSLVQDSTHLISDI